MTFCMNVSRFMNLAAIFSLDLESQYNIQGGFFNVSPLNLAKSQSLYKIPYSNFFSPILLLGLGLRQIQGGEVKKTTLYIKLDSEDGEADTNVQD